MIRTIAVTFDDRRVVTRAIDAGLKLTDLATGLYSALEALQRAERDIDGYPTSTLSDGLPRGQSEDTSVERALEAMFHIKGERETFRDDLDTLVSLIDSMAYMVSACLGRYTPPAIVKTECDGRKLQGSSTPYVRNSKSPDNGWYDSGCKNVPFRSGLCVSCFHRARRWRLENDLPELNDDREVAA